MFGATGAGELQKLIQDLSYFQLACSVRLLHPADSRDQYTSPEGLSKGKEKAGQQFELILPASVCLNPIRLPLHTAPRL